MIAGHSSGTLFKVPERRRTQQGADWLRLTLKCAAGDAYVFASVAVFDADLVDRLAGIVPGEAVSVAGPIQLKAYADRDGQPATSLSIVANAVLSARDGRRRKPRGERE